MTSPGNFVTGSYHHRDTLLLTPILESGAVAVGGKYNRKTKVKIRRIMSLEILCKGIGEGGRGGRWGERGEMEGEGEGGDGG